MFKIESIQIEDMDDHWAGEVHWIDAEGTVRITKKVGRTKAAVMGFLIQNIVQNKTQSDIFIKRLVDFGYSF